MKSQENNSKTKSPFQNFSINLSDQDKHKSFNIITLIIILLIFTIIYSPFILIQFAHVDDWNLISSGWWQNSPIDEIRNGRILYDGFLRIFIIPIVKNNDSIIILPYLRFLNILLMVINVYIFYRFLRWLAVPTILSFCSSILIFILPGGVQRISHAIAFSSILGISIALLGGILITKLKFKILIFDLLNKKDIRTIAISLLFLIISCNTYQGSAMFYLLPIAAFYLFNNDNFFKKNKLIAIHILIFCISLLLYFILNKFILIPILKSFIPAARAPGPLYYNFNVRPIDQIISSIKYIYLAWLPVGLKLWLFKTSWFNYFIGFFIFFFNIYILIKNFHSKNKITSLALNFLLINIFIILVNIPEFMSQLSKGPFFRLLFPTSALIVLYFIWLIKESNLIKNNFLVAMIVIATILFSSVAYKLALDTALESNIELNIFKSAIGQLIKVSDPTKQLFIIPPPDTPTYIGTNYSTYTDEFLRPTTQWLNFSYKMFDFLTKGNNVSRKIQNIHDKTYLTFDSKYFDDNCKRETVYLKFSAVIADMTAPLRAFPSFYDHDLSSCTDEIIRYITFPNTSFNHSSINIFNKSGKYWQTESYPVSIQFFLNKPKIILSYELNFHKKNINSPTSWKFEGSLDNYSWTTLDKIEHYKNNTKSFYSRYIIKNRKKFKFYRIVFLNGYEKKFRIYGIKLIF